MPKDYTPKEVKPTGTFDSFGNAGYQVYFTDGSYGFMSAKFPPEAGKTEYGEITDAPKKDKPGETYKRFKRMKRDEFTPVDQAFTAPPTVLQAPQPQASNLEQRIDQLEKDVAFLKEMTVPSVTPSKTSQNGSGGLSGVSADDFQMDDEIDISSIPF